jgi:hypothetical protein
MYLSHMIRSFQGIFVWVVALGILLVLVLSLTAETGVAPDLGPVGPMGPSGLTAPAK